MEAIFMCVCVCVYLKCVHVYICGKYRVIFVANALHYLLMIPNYRIYSFHFSAYFHLIFTIRFVSVDLDSSCSSFSHRYVVIVVLTTDRRKAKKIGSWWLFPLFFSPAIHNASQFFHILCIHFIFNFIILSCCCSFAMRKSFLIFILFLHWFTGKLIKMNWIASRKYKIDN